MISIAQWTYYLVIHESSLNYNHKIMSSINNNASFSSSYIFLVPKHMKFHSEIWWVPPTWWQRLTNIILCQTKNQSKLCTWTLSYVFVPILTHVFNTFGPQFSTPEIKLRLFQWISLKWLLIQVKSIFNNVFCVIMLVQKKIHNTCFFTWTHQFNYNP